MASFSDQISQFNPYIQQLPVETMAKVGMYKQQQYDQGVQKIQSYVDNVAGIDVLNPTQKQYVQSKLDDLGSRLKSVAAGDFSNSQLVNSVGGMATSIMKDTKVQNAVLSTQKIRQGVADMTAANKNGKGGPDNDWAFNSSVSTFMADTDVNASYNGKYINKYDIDKDIQDAVSKAHISSEEWEENALNPDGTVNADILLEKSKKGLLSGRVKSIVDSVFSKPEVQQQLAISGTYQYRNYTPEMLKEMQDKSITYVRDKAKANKERIACAGVISDYEAANANKAIINIDNQLKESEAQYGSYMKLLDDKRYDEAKISLYKDNKEQQYQTDYSWEDNSMKSKINPWFDVQMKRATYNLAVQKEAFDEGDANRKFNEQVRQFGLTYDLSAEDAQRKRDIATGKLNADGSPKVLYTTGAANPNEIIKLGSGTYIASTQALKDQVNQIQAKVISTLPGFEDLYTNTDGTYKFNYSKYGDWKTVEPKYRMALVELEKAHMNGTVKPNYRGDVQSMHDLQSQVAQNTQVARDIDIKYKPLLDSIASKISDIKTNDGVTKTDLIQFWMVANSKDPATSAAAKQYIEAKFGKGQEGEIYTKAATLDIKHQKQYDEIDDIMSSNPTLLSNFENREMDYKKVQQQNQSYYATINVGKTEDKLLVNQQFSNLLAKEMGGKTGGVYGEMAKMLSAKDPSELNENLYDYWRGSDNKWYAQVRRNLGSGTGYKYSEVLPISRQDAIQLGAKEDPIEDAFVAKFGGYLNNFGGKQTTKSLISPEAENTAIDRRAIGKYSVGWQLKELNGGYVPYAYVRDRNGNVLSSGMEVDFSVFSHDPRLTVTQRESFKNVQSIMSKQDVLTKLGKIDESFITLMLNNNR